MLDELVVLSEPSGQQTANDLLQRLRTGDLRVALVGEAKRGKSTLGNAMLGSEVLPAGVVPVTSIRTEVRVGSPRRAEVTFADGSVDTTDVGDVERFVSERHNSHNHKQVTAVRVFLPEGLPHPRMVLVDTPGVGSVHQHNTDQAQAAFQTMDAAIFVLTATPPMSASELTLLRQVTAQAVRIFLVLNKADQLEPNEVVETTRFVADVAAGVLGSRPQLWLCSAREGLRGRCNSDVAGWMGSGVPVFLDALLDHLVQHREHDLRVSIATAAARLAAQQLDGVTVTLAALEALAADNADRVRELGQRMGHIDQRRAEAMEFIAAKLARERSRLDGDAAAEVAVITTRVRERLKSFLTTATHLGGTELQQQGREVVADAARASVEYWRAAWHVRLNEALVDLLELEQRLLDEAAGDVHAAARDLLGVRLQTAAPLLASSELPELRYDFQPDAGWNEALVSGLRSFAPARIVRHRVGTYLMAESARLVDKHMGRARADFQARLEEAARRLRPQVAVAFHDVTEGLRTGCQAALDRQQSTEPGHQPQRQRLIERRESLLELDGRLRAEAGAPTGHAHQRSSPM